MSEATSQPPRQRVPKDGPGPRGAPDCYYTSRVLNSTFRYAKFVRRLRAEEEEQRKGEQNKLKELHDRQTSDFFLHCDRKSYINDVARRVDLCLASYEEDLKAKRSRLIELFQREEEANIRKFVEQAQAGAEAVWQDKLDRLQYLLDKRKKEHEEKYKDTPLSKCVHVLPCIYKLRAKEAEEIQLYQIREKAARKMAEKEFDKMWHEVAMKESEALTARMEQDTIERLRRDQECIKYSDYMLEQRRIQREKEREMLIEETKRFKALWDAENKKEEEAERQRLEQSKETALDRKRMLQEKQEIVAKQQQEAKLISDTWASLAGQGLADEKAQIMLRRQKEMELDECNRKMIELKQEFADMEKAVEGPMAEEARQRQEMLDKKRCEYLGWAQRTNREVRQAMIDQIKDRQHAREVLQQKMKEQDEYQRQVFSQLNQLSQHKELTDAQARKKHQQALVEQIEYNKLLKERARQEELDQIKKCQLATEEYQNEIGRMLCRPFFSEEIHPFMKQMAKGLEMREKCPCSQPDYCK
ncbi:axoneme-associated protein mst101(2)-like [Maniola jurtina]|uniref:axoneme-associated protein mst101(2)-like n=1 Tax=Maniola jurtina TaxID=191418 RepID=UPI001E685FC6|nr:axoneme-associated protein mst101(2)-like [Maniola jurtina]XP_045762453.1 axoneme-associated protein mst101(2)-like [Maniola jurtina]XP_045762454.1 axoneme-associated protein mst101(2)-like [Maniola jurtina]XP_045762455.1 axoneme-associated protein mst101(2)-like [Maniola jurtina]XP_045762456.1 axoneme-associated protein mst101(2)-like [Maniola jurtina]